MERSSRFGLSIRVPVGSIYSIHSTTTVVDSRNSGVPTVGSGAISIDADIVFKFSGATAAPSSHMSSYYINSRFFSDDIHFISRVAMEEESTKKEKPRK